jgi:hypothetical protein
MERRDRLDITPRREDRPAATQVVALVAWLDALFPEGHVASRHLATTHTQAFSVRWRNQVRPVQLLIADGVFKRHSVQAIIVFLEDQRAIALLKREQGRLMLGPDLELRRA